MSDTPRTEAGKRLREKMPYWKNSAHKTDAEVVEHILAIEAEAAADGDLTTAYMVGYEKGKAAASPSTDTSTALREAAEAVDAAWLAFDVPGWSVERAFPLRAAMNALHATLSVTPQDTTE